MNTKYTDLLLSFLKVLIIMSIFFYIRRLNIPDNYKILLTILPTILILSFNNLSNQFKYKGRPKPIILNKNDNISDKYLVDDYLFENFENNSKYDKLFIVADDVQIYEVEKPFWISKGYLDISNPNNFINLNKIKLGSNYTIELWLKLKYLSNNNILSFYERDKIILEVKYDDNFLHINDSTKIPIKDNEWFQLTIMRGKYDTIGTDRGLMYINGIFNGYIKDIPNLSKLTHAYLFKHRGIPQDYNRKYNDLSNCSVVRIYNRSLSLDEIQNNYLREAAYYQLEEENLENLNKSYVQDDTLVFYLDTRSFDREKPIVINNDKRDWLVKAKEYTEKTNEIIKKQPEDIETKNIETEKTKSKSSKPIF